MKTTKECKPRRNRPWVWFVCSGCWLVDVVQDLHAGTTYVYDLLAFIAALWLGVYFCRQQRQQALRAVR